MPPPPLGATLWTHPRAPRGAPLRRHHPRPFEGASLGQRRPRAAGDGAGGARTPGGGHGRACSGRCWRRGIVSPPFFQVSPTLRPLCSVNEADQTRGRKGVLSWPVLSATIFGDFFTFMFVPVNFGSVLPRRKFMGWFLPRKEPFLALFWAFYAVC